MRSIFWVFSVLTLLLGTSGRNTAQWQDPDSWTAHTAMGLVRSMDYHEGVLWAGSIGGVFSYSFADDTYRSFRNINELVSIDINKVVVDKSNGIVYAGSADGVLSIFEGEKWRNNTSIRAANLPNASIYDLTFKGDSILVSAGYGLSVYDKRRDAFVEDVFRISNLPVRSPVYSTLLDDEFIWVSTEGYVARIRQNAQALAAPTAWETFAIGTANAAVLYLTRTADGQLFAATSSRLFRLQGGEFVEVGEPLQFSITGIESRGTSLFVITEFQHFAIESDGSARLLFENYDAAFRSVAFFRSNGVEETAIGTAGEGIRLLSSQRRLLPNSPHRNLFVHTDIDAAGRLWCVSGRTDRETGTVFFLDTTGVWRRVPEPIIGTPIYHRVNADPDGSVWVSGFGNGLLHLFPDEETVEEINRYTGSNAPFASASTTSDYFIIADAVPDNSGNIWTSSFNFPGVMRIDAEGKWQSFRHPTLQPRQILRLAVDDFNTKWFGSFDREGLYYFNEGSSGDNTEDNRWGHFSSNNSNLANNSITAIAVDRSGVVWVGTRSGVSAIINPNEVRSETPRFILRTPRELLGQVVNDIAIDPSNQKWIATATGIWVMSADGTQIVRRITTENSLLPENVVESIAFSPEKGIAWIGTRNGLYEVKTRISSPVPEFNEIRCYPQPFDPDRDAEMIIDGLAGNSIVTIMTLNGDIIRTFDAGNSRQTVWNGRTDSGTLAPAGVYLVAAYSADTGSTAVGKAALVYRR